MGLVGLIVASYGGLWGILTGLAKSTDHPSGGSWQCHMPQVDLEMILRIVSACFGFIPMAVTVPYPRAPSV